MDTGIPKYPDVRVQLVGMDGNAFNIIGRVATALVDHGVSRGETHEFIREATASDYDHVLQTAMRWVSVE